MTITNADLDQLDALAEAATPGPWHYDDGITDEIDGVPERGKPPLVEDMRARWIASTDGMVGEDGFTQEEADANGRLVAAARDAVPALTSEVRRLRGGGGACRADPNLVEIHEALVAEVRRLRGVVPATVAPPALGARLRDLTVAQLEALPDGTEFEDLREVPMNRAIYGFVKRGDQWVSPALTTCSSERLREVWCDDEDYRLTHLPESP